MSTIPEPEELGRIILDIYKQGNIRAGEMIPIGRIETLWRNNKGRTDDLRSGLNWLIANGFLEEKGRAFFLTEDGFNEM
ncbi:MAG: hypothetical protein WBC05_23620 [Sedimentisphaerales bacterium]